MSLPWDTLDAFSGRMAWFAWQVLWQSSLLVLALWWLDLVLKRRVRASVRYGLWLLVLVKLLIPPSFSAPSGLAWWIRPPQISPGSASRPAASMRVSYVDAPPATLPQAGVFSKPAKAPGCSMTTMGAAGSLFVTAALLAWMAWRQRQLAAILRRASPAPAALEDLLTEARRALKARQPVRLLVTSEPVSPALCGLLRPTILLPESLAARLSPAQARSVLVHELAHFMRGDVWMSCIQSLLQVVYWWHPLLWFANAKIRRAREEAVDDTVVSALSEQSSDYATTLLEVARMALRRPFAVLGFVGILESSATLRRRIERLLNSQTSHKAGIGAVSLLWIAAFAAVALPMGPAVERANEPNQPAQTSRNSNAQREQPTTTNVAIPTIRVDVARNSLTAEGAVHLQTNRIPTSEEPLYTRGIQVDPNSLRVGLERTLGANAARTNPTPELLPQLLEFFALIGIDLRPPKTFFYKDRYGLLIVRATQADLGAIETAVRDLSVAPTQIHARIEVARLGLAKAAEFWAGLAVQPHTNRFAFLNKEEAARQLERLKELAAPDKIDQASITTLSGRRAQIQIGEMLNLAVNGPDGHPQPTPLQTNQVPLGITVDFLPYAGEDTVQMHVFGAFTEFLGYDDPGQFVPQQKSGTGARPIVAALPLPRFRVRRVQKSVIAADQQTLVIGGSEEIETDRVPVFGGDRPELGRLFRRSEQKEELVLFVTATIVDPAGNPVHKQDR